VVGEKKTRYKNVCHKSSWAAAHAAFIVFGASLAFATAAQAETARIVAFGASNTSGYAVGASNAWPAQLESMLRAKGYDVSVTNAGVTGETSAQSAARIDSAIPPGTKIVIYDLGGGNDRDSGEGGNTAANTARVVASIRAHGAIAISSGKVGVVGSEKSNPSAWIQGDPHHHMTAQSHTRVAAALVPKVIAALGKKK
jgi:acyl-CoA thioesterase-1